MPKSVLFDREEVINKVMRLFWRKGYNGTSMQELVDATGLNRSSFYNSFGDKFQLFEEALTSYQRMQNDKIEKISTGSTSPVESIKQLFYEVRDEIVTSIENNGCFISNCTSELSNEDPRIRNFLVKNMEGVVKRFESLIKEAQKLGEIDTSRDPRALALYLFSSLQGLRVTSMIDPNIQGVTDEILKAL